MKKRFIAGAKCPKCGKEDSIMLLMKSDDELDEIVCVVCEHTEMRPTEEQMQILNAKKSEGTETERVVKMISIS